MMKPLEANKQSKYQNKQFLEDLARKHRQKMESGAYEREADEQRERIIQARETLQNAYREAGGDYGVPADSVTPSV